MASARPRVGSIGLLLASSRVLAACGGGDGHATRLRITVALPYAAPDGGIRRLELTCDPPGGTAPDPARLCDELAGDPLLLEPPAMSGTCAGAPGIPPDIGIEGMFAGETVEIATLRSCDGPAQRARIAERWYRLLGIEP